MGKIQIINQAKYFAKTDKRLSWERCLSEAIMEDLILDLDNKRRIPKKRLTR
jgi:hypothetical protein